MHYFGIRGDDLQSIESKAIDKKIADGSYLDVVDEVFNAMLQAGNLKQKHGKILIPLNTGGHWVAFEIRMHISAENRISVTGSYLDPLGGALNQTLQDALALVKWRCFEIQLRNFLESDCKLETIQIEKMLVRLTELFVGKATKSRLLSGFEQLEPLYQYVNEGKNGNIDVSIKNLLVTADVTSSDELINKISHFINQGCMKADIMQSDYVQKRVQEDGSSCGVITSEIIASSISGEDFSISQPFGAPVLREKQLLEVREHYRDLNRLIFGEQNFEAPAQDKFCEYINEDSGEEALLLPTDKPALREKQDKKRTKLNVRGSQPASSSSVKISIAANLQRSKSPLSSASEETKEEKAEEKEVPARIAAPILRMTTRR